MAEAATLGPRPSVRTVKPSGATVMVACKLPGGLLADVKSNDGELVRVMFRGVAAQRRLERLDESTGRPVDIPGITSVRGGYGLTEVDADFAKRWFDENAKYQPVAEGLIFMVEKPGDHAVKQAEERAEIKSGLEPIDPTKVDARRRTAGFGEIEVLERN